MDADRLFERITPQTFQEIGELAVRATIFKDHHEANVVLEQRSQVGPGSTQESAAEAGRWEGRVRDRIKRAFYDAEQVIIDEERKDPAPAEDSAQTSAQGEGPKAPEPVV